MFHIVLHQPEIPPNTGNIIRLTANLGASLHLIEPLGFSLSEKSLRRAGLDYHALAQVERHADTQAFLEYFAEHADAGARIYAASTRGLTRYDRIAYRPGDALLFGAESKGLPDELREHPGISDSVYLPMCSGNRSLNLSNAVAVLAMEAWRQQGFTGSAR